MLDLHQLNCLRYNNNITNNEHDAPLLTFDEISLILQL